MVAARMPSAGSRSACSSCRRRVSSSCCASASWRASSWGARFGGGVPLLFAEGCLGALTPHTSDTGGIKLLPGEFIGLALRRGPAPAAENVPVPRVPIIRTGSSPIVATSNLLSKLAHLPGGVADLLFRKLGEDRQGQHLPASLLRHRQIPFLVAQVGEALLLVQAQRVVNAAAHAAVGKLLLERVALAAVARHANHVLVVNAAVPARDRRGNDARVRQHLVVNGGVATAGGVPSFQVVQLHVQHR